MITKEHTSFFWENGYAKIEGIVPQENYADKLCYAHPCTRQNRTTRMKERSGSSVDSIVRGRTGTHFPAIRGNGNKFSMARRNYQYLDENCSVSTFGRRK